MTLNGAIMQLVEMRENSMMPVVFKPYFDKVIETISECVDPSEIPQWIPCSERLPEDDTEVFVYLFDRPSPYIAWVTDCHWFTEDFQVEKENYPSAWMPLPEAWKGEDNG